MDPHKTTTDATAGVPTAEFEHELFGFLLDHIPDRIYFKDRESRFLRINRAMADLFRLSSPADAIGMSDADFFGHEHAASARADEVKILETGETISGQVEQENMTDGRARWAITTKMPLRDRRGEIIGTCGISKDFTSQKALEDQLKATLEELQITYEKLKASQEQLVESEKIQALGRLALGVAHEVRNPLNIINMAAECLGGKPELSDDPAAQAVIGAMKEAVIRANAVITEISNALEAADLQLEESRIEEIIDSVLGELAGAISKAGVSVERSVSEGLPPVRAHRHRMQEAFLAVFRNAIDAMPQGGALSVNVEDVVVSETTSDKGSRSSRRLRLGDRILRITVADSGEGISVKNLPNVFDLFFTTKATGKGMGLGLTVARKTIELHGGTIAIFSSEKEGTRVVVDLPAMADTV